MALLELSKVCKHYEGPESGQAVNVLHDVSLGLDSGKTLAIVGPSGSGKSTLLNLIGALDQPSSGEIVFDGKQLMDMTDVEAAAFRNREIGFVFQQHHLLPQCTVLENVLLPCIPLKIDRRARAEELLDRVGLCDRLHHRPGQLSGGECQRTAVVRALINEPRLLLADEPTGALDHETALTLTKLLKELNTEQGVSIILVTHALDLAADMDRALELKNGRVEA